MRENITVKPDKTRLINLIEDLNDGVYQIPIFQRDFVWKPNQLLELFDSIRRGYPVGSLLFWKPGTEFKTKEKIGPFTIPPIGENALYILDGYQRITTLFSVLSNPEKHGLTDDSREVRDFAIYYDLKIEEFGFQRHKKDKKNHLIPLYKIVDTYEFLDFLRQIEMTTDNEVECKKMIDNAKKLSKIFYDYEIPFVEIKGGDIKSAVEIFSRVNSTGQDISTDFMLSALNYDTTTGFLFSEAISVFLNKLTPYNFDELKRDTVLNCISNSKGKVYFDVRIEELKNGLNEMSTKAFIHIERAIKFLYYDVNVINAKLLPYPTQLIFLSEFFRVNPNPDNLQRQQLREWFWITSYSNYFTVYSLSQQRSAYKEFMDFAHKKSQSNGVYKLDDTPFETINFPAKLNYSSVRAKVLQLFYLNRISEGQRGSNATVVEQFLFGNKDKSPGNMVLRFGSEFETDEFKKDVSHFLYNTEETTLKKYFVNESMLSAFQNNQINEFIEMREQFIRLEEGSFVRNLGITYFDDIFIFNQ